jgi:2-polyprenyl-3-methyl-5-hydroxy-6-metoxy-1,4-benzoquinol methylase
MLKKYSKYFEYVQGLKIANICGSCGKKAVPLSILGALVTVFDISEENKKYACETASAANTPIDYVIGDVMDIDMSVYEGYFDVVFMEGGILHYFHDIDRFMKIMNNLLKNNGKIICSDFHPIRKCINVNWLENQKVGYFSNDIIEGEMPHAKFYDDEIRKQFPKCSLRLYTLGEIINSVINSGFSIQEFEEYPAWTNEKLPGEFTLLAYKA